MRVHVAIVHVRIGRAEIAFDDGIGFGSSTLLSGSDARPGSVGSAEKAISPDMSAKLRNRALIDVRVLRKGIDMSLLIFLNVEVTWQMR